MGITPYRYPTAVGERLAIALADRGFSSARFEGALELKRVAEIVNRDNPRPYREKPITENMLRGYIYAGKAIPLEVAAVVAKTIGFRLEEIAYEKKVVTNPKPRKVRGIVDEIEKLVRM